MMSPQAALVLGCRQGCKPMPERLAEVPSGNQDYQ